MEKSSMSVGSDSLITVVPTVPDLELHMRESLWAEQEEDTNSEGLRGYWRGAGMSYFHLEWILAF